MEVNGKLDPTRFTLRTIEKRLDPIGDLWRPVLGPGVDLQSCLERLHASGRGEENGLARRKRSRSKLGAD